MNNTGIVTIRGKEYQTVALRVQKFRESFPTHGLETEIMHRDKECVVVRAVITTPEDRIIATGHAEEYRESSQINQTSALENCETSAIGRALAALGLAGSEFASADELKRAIVDKQKPNTATQVMHDQYDAMSEEERAFIDNLAANVAALLDEGRGPEAWALCTNNLQAEEQLALWSRMGKPHQKQLKAAKPTPEAK